MYSPLEEGKRRIDLHISKNSTPTFLERAMDPFVGDALRVLKKEDIAKMQRFIEETFQIKLYDSEWEILKSAKEEVEENQ